MKASLSLFILAFTVSSVLAQQPEKLRQVYFRVVSVIDGGIIAEEFSPGYRDRQSETIAVVCDTEGFTDDAELTAMLQRDGVFQFISTDGAKRTVKKYRAAQKPVEYQGP